MLKIKKAGSTNRTLTFLNKIKKISNSDIFKKYGELGVALLSSNTPIDTGNTRDKWSYEITKTKTTTTIHFNNQNINKGVPIAIILQYGHGTGTGGYVSGRDYINPAVQEAFDSLVVELWKEVSSA